MKEQCTVISVSAQYKLVPSRRLVYNYKQFLREMVRLNLKVIILNILHNYKIEFNWWYGLLLNAGLCMVDSEDDWWTLL